MVMLYLSILTSTVEPVYNNNTHTLCTNKGTVIPDIPARDIQHNISCYLFRA